MPGVYREKTCPKCGKTHRKKGPYCSQSCASIGHKVSEENRQRFMQIVQDYNQSPEGKANQTRLKANSILQHIYAEDYAIDIPTFYEVPDGYLSDFE